MLRLMLFITTALWADDRPDQLMRSYAAIIGGLLIVLILALAPAGLLVTVHRFAGPRRLLGRARHRVLAGRPAEPVPSLLSSGPLIVARSSGSTAMHDEHEHPGGGEDQASAADLPPSSAQPSSSEPAPPAPPIDPDRVDPSPADRPDQERSDDPTSAEVQRAVDERIRAEALRQLDAIDLDDDDWHLPSLDELAAGVDVDPDTDPSPN